MPAIGMRTMEPGGMGGSGNLNGVINLILVNLLSMSDVLKKGIRTFVGGCMALFTISCEVDFNPYSNADAIPVIYAIINPADSLYYIRLTKTFQYSGKTSQGAKLPTIQFFEHPTVGFELLTYDNKLLNRGFLTPMVIPAKEPGFFSQEPNLVYGISQKNFEFENDDPMGNIDPTKLILKIKTTETDFLTYAKVDVTRPARIRVPRTYKPYSFSLFEERMEKISWDGTTNQFHTVVFRIGYSEYVRDSVRNDFVDVEFSVDPLDPTKSYDDFYELPVDGQVFLRKLNASFRSKKEPADLDYRKITSLDILVVSVNDEYRLYMNALKRDANIDIEAPSNITNGIGLFCVKHIATSSGHTFNMKTMDSIANSHITKHLKFVKW